MQDQLAYKGGKNNVETSMNRLSLDGAKPEAIFPGSNQEKLPLVLAVNLSCDLGLPLLQSGERKTGFAGQVTGKIKI